jgi:hypothetical protein
MNASTASRIQQGKRAAERQPALIRSAIDRLWRWADSQRGYATRRAALDARVTEITGALPGSTVHARVRSHLAALCDEPRIREGSRVVAGHGDDADAGWILAIEDGYAIVAWDSGVRTQTDLSLLCLEADPR